MYAFDAMLLMVHPQACELYAQLIASVRQGIMGRHDVC